MMLATTAPETIEAPYRSVRHALRSAFGAEGRDIVKSPTLFMSRMSDSTLTPHDRAAQSAIVLSLLHDQCRLQVIYAATAQYMPPDWRSPRGRLISQSDAIDACTNHVQTYPHLSGYPWDYLRDVVCLWADAPMSRSEPSWMAILGKSSRMLRYIKFGNRDRGKPGVCQLLDDLLNECNEVLGECFSRRGLIDCVEAVVT